MHLPEHPLERFTALWAALDRERGIFEDATALRYAAATLLTLDGSPVQAATSLRRTAATLKERAGWFGAMNSAIRFVVAALLTRNNDDPAAFCDEVTRAEELFSAAGMKPRSVYSALSVLILRGPERRPLDRATVERMHDVYQLMRDSHWWLTGVDDYPTAALLAASGVMPSEIDRRVESFYEGLRDLGFSRGGALQTASHLMFFNPAGDEISTRRFRALYDAFRAEGLHMHSGDYDEMAYLTFLTQPPATIVATTLSHRARIEELKPRPSADVSFSLACNTALLELSQIDETLRRVTDVQALLQVQSILSAQQAAAASAAV